MRTLTTVRPAARRTRLTLVASALTTLVAACGGGGSDSSESPTAVLSAGATAAPAALAQTPSTSAAVNPASGTPPAGSVTAPERSGKPTAAACAPTVQFPKGTVLTVRMRAADGSELTSRTTSLGPVVRGGAQLVEFRTVPLGGPEGT